MMDKSSVDHARAGSPGISQHVARWVVAAIGYSTAELVLGVGFLGHVIAPYRLTMETAICASLVTLIFAWGDRARE